MATRQKRTASVEEDNDVTSLYKNAKNGDSNGKTKPVKRRNRVTLVCNVCKFRKVRCDRKQPHCTSCVKYNASHLCEYNGQVWSEKEALEKLSTIKPSVLPNQNLAPEESSEPKEISEVDSLRKRVKELESYILFQNQFEAKSTIPFPTKFTDLISGFQSLDSIHGINPIQDNNDLIDLYNYNSIASDLNAMECVNHGPFSRYAIRQKDLNSKNIWNFMYEGIRGKNKVYTKDGVTQLEGKSNPYSLIQRIKKYSVNKFDPQNYSRKSSSLPLGLTYNDPTKNIADSREERIKSILPLQNIIDFHIDNFFDFLYPFFPYISEPDFRKQISRILRTKSTLNIESKNDYAILGLLCIVMRLSYLSMITNNMEINENNVAESSTSEIKKLLLHPIGIEFIDTARDCLNEFQLFHRTNLFVLQLAIFIKIYMTCAPEEPEGIIRNQFQIYNGVLVEMGYSMGLNRDYFHDNPSKINLRRKIWMYLRTVDTTQSMLYGNPYITSDRFTDAEVPSSSGGMEDYVVKAMEPLSKLLNHIQDILRLVLYVKKGISVVQLVEKLNILETYLFTEYGTIQTFFDAYMEKSFSDNFSKTLQLNVFIPVKFFLMALHNELFLYYENKQNLGIVFFYVKKILAGIVEEVLPYTLEFLEQPNFYFKYASQLLLNPSFQLFLHRVNTMLFSLINRTGFSIEGLHIEDPKYEKYKLLKKYLVRCLKLTIIGILKLSHRQCSAWRTGNSHTFILENISSDDYYKESNESSDVRVFDFTENQLNDLINYIERLFPKLDMPKLAAAWKSIHGAVDPARSRFFDNKPNDIKEDQNSNNSPTSPNDNDLWHSRENWQASSFLQQDFTNVMESLFHVDDPLFYWMNEDINNQPFEFNTTSQKI